VLEAAEGSGSLITARDALDQGREVLAVPGHPVDARAAGCNRLIRDGCTLIRSAEDVIEALAPALAAARSRRADYPGHRVDTAFAPPPKPGLSRLAEAAGRILSRPAAAGRLPPSPVAPSPVPPGPATRPEVEIRALHQQILERLSPSPLAEDQLIRDLDVPATRISSALLTLELDGRVERQAGGLLVRGCG
jgi:DNA processing protein